MIGGTHAGESNESDTCIIGCEYGFFHGMFFRDDVPRNQTMSQKFLQYAPFVVSWYDVFLWRAELLGRIVILQT